MPNPVGKPVYAAAAGRVIWAADNYRWIEDGIVDAAYTYGNVIIIEHDFGYEGQRLYTLYAHLVQILVTPNQRVEAGEVIGLSGQSGVVSGPHVHFEVRVGKNNYGQTRNPVLWMVPYEGYGVIAGRVVYTDGKPVEDVTVALMSQGKIIDTTTTYVILKRPGVRVWTVNSDEVWKENFAFGDVPPGDYQVVVNFGGLKLSRDITVRPSTTAFADTINIPIIQSTPNGQPTSAP
jgi:murein DD-endopeptidase MepM/ murein hydrolase activator NlpD